MFRKGILTAAGAQRLGVPQLAQQQVDYEPIGHSAGEIYYQGRRLGCNMSLGSDGIVPCDQETEMSFDLIPFAF